METQENNQEQPNNEGAVNGTNSQDHSGNNAGNAETNTQNGAAGNTNTNAEKDKPENAKSQKNAKAKKTDDPEATAYAEAFNRYTILFGSVPNELLTTETINKLIEIRERENETVNAAGNTNTNAEKENTEKFEVSHNNEKYTFPVREKSNFIVRHSKMGKMDSGSVMEDPGSIRIQIYRPEVYADLIHENEKTGEANAFVQSGDKTVVLHDPTK